MPQDNPGKSDAFSADTGIPLLTKTGGSQMFASVSYMALGQLIPRFHNPVLQDPSI
jgi:hypothetical protein